MKVPVVRVLCLIVGMFVYMVALVKTINIEEIAKIVVERHDLKYLLIYDALSVACNNVCFSVTGPLAEPQIAYVTRETVKGLQYLHSRGKMHRDIKVSFTLKFLNYLQSLNKCICNNETCWFYEEA